jgi:hypothetical protein
MLVQRTFKQEYVEELATAVKKGQGLERYAAESFDYDSRQVVIIPSLQHPEGLVEKMIPTTAGDFVSAVALYEAYPNISLIQASDRAFWIYLAHTDLFQYVQNRFSKVKEDDFNNAQYILDHWFFAGGMLMQSLSGLWWMVHISIDELASGDEKYKYTQTIFRDYTLRTNFAQYSLARHKEAVFGYLQFIMDNPELFSTFFKVKNRFVTKYFNKVGGARLLSTLPREYFYEELQKISSDISKINTDEL